MKRKLIKQGGGGCVIYVPKKWLDFNNLKAGNELDIKEEENSLILNPDEKDNKIKKIEINLPEKENNYYSFLGALYRACYDEIKLKYNDSKIISVLEKNLNKFYGFELFDITEKYCIIKNIFEIQSPDVKQYFKKMIHMLNTIHSLVIDDINNNKFTSKHEIEDMRSNLLKQRNLIQRVINKNKLLDFSNFPFLRISNYIWDVSRNYSYLYTKLITKKKITTKSKQVLEDINDYFKLTFNNLDKHDFAKTRRSFEKIYKNIMLLNNEYTPYFLGMLLSIESCNSDIYILNMHLNWFMQLLSQEKNLPLCLY